MAARVVRTLAGNAVISRGADEPPLLEFEYELPLGLFAPEVWQIVIDQANARLSVIEADLRIFTPVDTGRLVRSLFTKQASVGDPSIGGGYLAEYAIWVEDGWSNPATGAMFEGWHWFRRIVEAHIERLQADLFELARRLEFVGAGFDLFGV